MKKLHYLLPCSPTIDCSSQLLKSYQIDAIKPLAKQYTCNKHLARRIVSADSLAKNRRLKPQSLETSNNAANIQLKTQLTK